MKPITLAEFEARCLGKVPGEITRADVVQAYNLVEALSDAYSKKLFEKVDDWKSPLRVRRGAVNRMFGIEKSLPVGDRNEQRTSA